MEIILLLLFGPSLAQLDVSAPGLANSFAGSDAQADLAPHVAVGSLSPELFVAVWLSEYPLNDTGTDVDLMFARSVDGGGTWSSQAILNLNAWDDAFDDLEVSISSAPNDSFVVVWRFSGDPRYGSDEDIAFAVSTDAGRTWSYPAALNTNAAGDVDADIKPSVSCRDDGQCMCVWTAIDNSGTFGSDADVGGAMSINGGVTWQDMERINPDYLTDTFLDNSATVIHSSTTEDTWIVVWLTLRYGGDLDLAFSRSVKGSAWSDVAPLNHDALEDSVSDFHPVLAFGGKNVVVAWTRSSSNTDIMFAVSTDVGASWTNASTIDPGMNGDSTDEQDATVAFASACDAVAAWATDAVVPGSSGARTVILSQSTDSGVTWSAPSPILVPTGSNLDLESPSATVAGARRGDAGVVGWSILWTSRASLDMGSGSDYDILFVNATGTLFCGNGVIDCGEECDPAAPGNDTTCCLYPSCTLASIATVCRTAASSCDVEELCSGGGCPVDLFAPASSPCSDGDACTYDDACDGSGTCTAVNNTCGDGVMACGEECDLGLAVDWQCCNRSTCMFERGGAVCRPANDSCDIADTCTGLSDLCGISYAPAGTVCRNTTGPCDVTELCTGVSALCPPDIVLANGTVCRPAAASCDVVEVCDGSNVTCPTDLLAPLGKECRSSVDTCDAAEFCTGANATCPADRYSVGVVCRVASLPCDAPEICSGTSPACPPDTPMSNSSVCRAALGACEVDEYCDGTNFSCPIDTGVFGNTTVCRNSSGGCDLVERCDGSSPVCPPDVVAPAGTVCRAAVGPCDAPEECGGSSALCPADSLWGVTTPCRAAVDVCDAAEYCDGVNTSCPADGVQPSTHVCRASAGTCDVEELCDAVSLSCPNDTLRHAGFVCRPSIGACDSTEKCDGISGGCPTDSLHPSSHECRAPAFVCDAAELCDGFSIDCPVDVNEASGVACEDLDNCTVGDQCDGLGTCLPGVSQCVGASIVVPEVVDEKTNDWLLWIYLGIGALTCCCLFFTAILCFSRDEKHRAADYETDNVAFTPPSLRNRLFRSDTSSRGSTSGTSLSLSRTSASFSLSLTNSSLDDEETAGLLSDMSSLERGGSLEQDATGSTNVSFVEVSSSGYDLEMQDSFPRKWARLRDKSSTSNSTVSSWGEDFTVIEGNTHTHTISDGHSFGKMTGEDVDNHVLSFAPTKVFYHGDPDEQQQPVSPKKERIALSLSKRRA